MIKDYDIPLETPEEVAENLFHGRWHEDAKQLPIEYMEPDEQRIIQKYIQYQELTPEEETQVKEILERFRPAINKINPQGVMENIDENTQYIEDEHAFLEMVDETSSVQVIPFTFRKNGKTYRMKLDLYPLTNGQAINDITSNLSMFRDMTEDEIITYDKMQHRETLSREEMLIRARVEEKVRQATIEHTRETLIEFLSLQLKYHGKDSSVETMKNTFNRIPDVYLSLLFDEVQRLNHIDDIQAEKVFQSFN